MPQGDKSAYTDKQKRKARDIEQGYEKRGVSREEAERRAWAMRSSSVCVATGWSRDAARDEEIP